MDSKMVEQLMEIHESAWDELMGAKHYMEKAHGASKQECKSMYKNMAADEMGHADKLIHEGDAMISSYAPSGEMADIWQHLKGRLHKEKAKIEARMKM